MAKPVLTRVRIALAVGFAFVCGWVDVVCLTRYKAFSTMMTGNMFQMGYGIIYPKFYGEHHLMPDPVFYFAVICCYFLGIVIHRIAEVKLPRMGRIFGPLFAIIVMTVELGFALEEGAKEEPRWIVCLYAVVFAIQNMMTLRDGLKTSTAFVTGHLHNLGGFAVEICRGNATTEDYKSHAVPVFVMMSLIFGSFTAAVWDKVFGQSMALVPIAPMMAVLFLLHDFVFRRKKPRKEEEADVEKAEAVRAKTINSRLRKQGSMYSTSSRRSPTGLRSSNTAAIEESDDDDDSDSDSDSDKEDKGNEISDPEARRRDRRASSSSESSSGSDSMATV
mmetsp:Transcript_79632/g.165421  ORF Transcript_79632/g.165421 Transcript_79632/m.165421 type:complete len:333 (-) Transcript_79632:363-1361(-)